MKGKVVATGAVVVVAAVVAALATGVLAPGTTTWAGADTGGSDADSFPTETPGSTGDAAATQPFTLTVDRVEKCGRTCRDVTTTLTNEQNRTAEDVTVYTRIYVGNGTDGEVIWENRRTVGTLGAGESVTTTERVSLSLTDALKVRNNDGWVTVQTTVVSDGETMTVTERRDVA